MRYVKVKDNTPINYSLGELFTDYPDAIIYEKTQMPSPRLLAYYDVYPLVTEASPTVREDEVAEESTPMFKQGEWHQTWKIRKLTKDEVQQAIENQNLNTFIDDTNEGYFASKELHEQRYEICKGCDSFTEFKTCNKCGCIMPLKVRFASSSCPLKKW